MEASIDAARHVGAIRTVLKLRAMRASAPPSG
jgi:hypothetical protein